ncbi:MAG: hypothetical protein K2Y37_16165 [Pirellulales bacterium]|nr:hypothetical protein [Pirellulales bacterium]
MGTRLGRLLFVFALMGGIAAESCGAEATSTDVAQSFWGSFLDGDAAAMARHYAPQVTLKAGSELLKADYGVNASGDRGKDLVVDRRDLQRGYEQMFKRVGREKWVASSQRLRDVKLTYISAADANKYFALFQAAAGELLVQVHTEPDPLFFLLRQDKHGRWSIVAEAFD